MRSARRMRRREMMPNERQRQPRCVALAPYAQPPLHARLRQAGSARRPPPALRQRRLWAAYGSQAPCCRCVKCRQDRPRRSAITPTQMPPNGTPQKCCEAAVLRRCPIIFALSIFTPFCHRRAARLPTLFSPFSFDACRHYYATLIDALLFSPLPAAVFFTPAIFFLPPMMLSPRCPPFRFSPRAMMPGFR